MKTRTPPPVPYDGFPLRPHQNGHWFKSVWNSRSKKSEQFYFGSWHEDPKGERAMKDPQIGWLARRDAIKAGIDNVRVELFSGEVTLGDLMARFLTHKRQKAKDGELSLTTLGDYLREVSAFVQFQKPGTPAGGLKPEHFTAYMRHLTDNRKLGRPARKRVRAYVTAFLRFGTKNGWMPMPNTGVDWATPACTPESLRQAKARAGLPDYSSRIVTGEEIDKLLERATPTFRAITLLAVNCGLGPADLGRLRWNMIDLERRRLIFPRPKSGAMRVGYLWRKTRQALHRVRTLKHNKLAIDRDGDNALVFVTRTGRPFYEEREIHRKVCIDGVESSRLVGVAISNAISITFSRMARDLDLAGVTAYRLVTHDARKFFQLLLKKNGYVLEQLFSPLVVRTTPEHAELKQIAHGCITRHHAHHYIGFADTQWTLFAKENPRRVKPLLYVYRVLLTGIHLMRTGEVEANLVKLNELYPLPYVPELIARKLAGPEQSSLPDGDFEFHRREYNRLVVQLKKASDESSLPEIASQRQTLNDLLVRLRLA